MIKAKLDRPQKNTPAYGHIPSLATATRPNTRALNIWGRFSDRQLMQDLSFDWLLELGLSKGDFSDLPDDENPLVWALRNEIVKEEAFIRWSSSHHQIPAIKAEFFSLAIDFSLLEKFSEIHKWDETCYPIYMWENTLFIACLEPVELSTTQKICFVASPFSAMEMAWNNHTKNVPEILTASAINISDLDLKIDLPPAPDQATNQVVPDIPPPPEVNLDNTPPPPAVDFESAPSLPEVDLENTPPPPPIDLDAANELDFSDISTANPGQEIQPKENTEVAQTPIENTVPDKKINGLTTATETIHVKAEKSEVKNLPLPNMDFKEISTAEMALEGDPPPPPADDQNELENLTPPTPLEHTQVDAKKEDTKIPTLTDIISKKTSQTEEMPRLETNSHIRPMPANKNPINDDYTPLPFLTKHEGPSQTTVRFDPTDPGSPLPTIVPIPPNNKISEADFDRYAKLDDATDIKGVIANVFHHLKNDYKKLMWIEHGEESNFYPKYAWGPWSITAQAWSNKVDLTHPNIFRIAHRSSLPFHGKIQSSPFNDRYFEAWTAGHEPSFATVYPVIFKEHCYGFLVGFSQGNSFDSVQSLKKIENLVSIIKSSFLNLATKQAS